MDWVTWVRFALGVAVLLSVLALREVRAGAADSESDGGASAPSERDETP